MTPKEIKIRLKMISYYDGSTRMCRENIPRKYPVDYPEALKVWTEMIKRNESKKAQVISLLDYAADEDDKNLLRMRFVQDLSPYEIADATCYSYSYSARRFKEAMERLAENAKDVPPFPY